MGDVTDLSTVLATCGPALGRVARVYAHTPQEREDLQQEILAAVWRALPTFRGESNVRTFVLRVAHNQGITWAARRRRFEPEVEVAEHDPRLDAAGDRRDLERALRSLPLAYRQILALALEDLSHAEIAAALGISENNVAVRMSRARDALRRAMGGPHG
jgi:RNA polymerase sigma-70 factor (ECF subfamily)